MKAFIRKLPGYFFQGLIFIGPIAVTLYIIFQVFKFVDNLLDFEFPGLGLLVLISGITLMGFLTKIIITQPAMNVFFKMIDKAPLIKLMYTSVKDLFSAFVGKEKKFNIPVLVKVGNDMERLGFLTQDELHFMQPESEKAAVYFPSSYGMLGELYIVPKSKITLLEGNAADIMKFIVSGGISKFDTAEANSLKPEPPF